MKARPRLKKASPTSRSSRVDDRALLERIRASLEDDKALDIVTIAMEGRSSLADAIVIATGTSSPSCRVDRERHLARRLKDLPAYGTLARQLARSQGDWVLVDGGDVIVSTSSGRKCREYYNLESMWSVEEPACARGRPDRPCTSYPFRGRIFTRHP